MRHNSCSGGTNEVVSDAQIRGAPPYLVNLTSGDIRVLTIGQIRIACPIVPRWPAGCRPLQKAGDIQLYLLHLVCGAVRPTLGLYELRC